MDRRTFAQTVAVTLGGAGMLAAMQTARCNQQPDPQQPADNVPPPQQPQAEEAAEAPAEPTPPEQLALELLLHRYPNGPGDEPLADAEKQQILAQLRGNYYRTRQLSSFPLANSNEPAFVFRAILDE